MSQHGWSGLTHGPERHSASAVHASESGADGSALVPAPRGADEQAVATMRAASDGPRRRTIPHSSSLRERGAFWVCYRSAQRGSAPAFRDVGHGNDNARRHPSDDPRRRRALRPGRQTYICFVPMSHAPARSRGRPPAALPEQRAKLFRTGGSQAVRLPKAFRLPGTEARIRRVGDAIVLEPVRSQWPVEFLTFLARGPDPVVRRQPQGRTRRRRLDF